MVRIVLNPLMKGELLRSRLSETLRTHLGPFKCMLGNEYLLKLADALFHTADGGDGPERVSVQRTEAVLPADLQQSHHSALLWRTADICH